MHSGRRPDAMHSHAIAMLSAGHCRLQCIDPAEVGASAGTLQPCRAGSCMTQRVCAGKERQAAHRAGSRGQCSPRHSTGSRLRRHSSRLYSRITTSQQPAAMAPLLWFAPWPMLAACTVALAASAEMQLSQGVACSVQVLRS